MRDTVCRRQPCPSSAPFRVELYRAKPRGSRSVSAEPFSPPTVENRVNTGVVLPMRSNSFALV